MSNMTVQCYSLNDLAVLCAKFVREGVQFDADTNTYVITLTGGY
jgi:hypothetical protein